MVFQIADNFKGYSSAELSVHDWVGRSLLVQCLCLEFVSSIIV